VVALDEDGVITLNNRTAAELLQDDATQSMKGMPVTALLPDCGPLLEQVKAKPQDLAEAQISLTRKNRHLNIYMRITAELKDDEIEGYIVTFDDITELVSAQRLAAWSDVARRVAHEIRNPLTPITLSTERLKRKYGEKLESGEERETFMRYVDTITRHVTDIGSIVEEFVSFARLPQAERAEGDLRKTLRDAQFSSQTAQENITHHLDVPDEPVMFAYDAKQISQVLTNLLKNAAEALNESETENPQIWLRLKQTDGRITITIEDNGPGFPEALIDKLTEPYVTTRPKGTGLGLAIVRRQIEEHRGRLQLKNRSGGGAVIRMTFPQS
jgi:two-component system nitrogen regulation sensor histidine kinase NtrY